MNYLLIFLHVSRYLLPQSKIQSGAGRSEMRQVMYERNIIDTLRPPELGDYFMLRGDSIGQMADRSGFQALEHLNVLSFLSSSVEV